MNRIVLDFFALLFSIFYSSSNSPVQLTMFAVIVKITDFSYNRFPIISVYFISAYEISETLPISAALSIQPFVNPDFEKI